MYNNFADGRLDGHDEQMDTGSRRHNKALPVDELIFEFPHIENSKFKIHMEKKKNTLAPSAPWRCSIHIGATNFVCFYLHLQIFAII